MKGKDIYEWIDSCKLYHLCLEDVQNMKPGDIIDVAIFDRNMEEYGMWDKIPANTYLYPCDIFKYNWHKIKYLGNLQWELQFAWGNFVHPIHFNTESFATNWNWVVPDESGNLNFESEVIGENSEMPNERKAFTVNIQTLHPRTRVGWRGPIMLWKYVEMPNKDQTFWRE